MVMTIWCWLTIHSSRNPEIDFHQEIKVKGVILKEYMESNKISFVNDFVNKHIDTLINEPIRVVRDSDCTYAE
jgi:hypothetical protein